MGEGLKIWREKRIKYEPGSTRARAAWIAHTEDFSIEFHIRFYGEELAAKHPDLVEGYVDGKPCAPFGIEIHSRTPARYDAPDSAPDHDDCTILGGKCWHDGTSLGASEFFAEWGGSDEQAFREVESWARREARKRAEEAEEGD